MLITIRQNMRTGRFHPFYWMEAPLPGEGVALLDLGFLDG